LKTIAHHALYIVFGQAGGEIQKQRLWKPECQKRKEAVMITFPPMPQTADREPIYKFTEEQVAFKSPLARQFIETRKKLNAKVEKADNYLVKRFYNIDHNTYLEGAIPSKYKELMGLVVSAGLRCDDCINYHIIQSYRLEATRAEQEEALNVALVVGGSIVIPHLRRAYAMLEELYS
jgi:AhpD family alkylhydroperoxidase